MKQQIICACIAISASQFSIAQNIGIGTTTPQSRLHVVDGSSGYSGGYFPGFTFEGSGNRYFNILTPSANEGGLVFGNPSNGAHGGIVYNNSSTPSGLQFRTNGNATRMVIDANGNVGIGRSTANFPLNFADALGDKISLWGTSGAHYGLGIQSLLMQIHTDNSAADIAFGSGSSSSFNESARIKGNGILQFQPSLQKKIILYPGGSGDASLAVFGNELRIASDYSGANITMGYDDRSTGFTERMRVMGNGNVGIGVTDPSFKLDVSDRMRIRSGGGFSSAGLYVNNSTNTASPGFIGLNDDAHVGFWGSGIGWGFAMNTGNGALRINGSEGTAGKVITSGGGSSGATWDFPVKAYQSSNPFVNITNTNETSLTSLSITTTGNSTLIICAQLSTEIIGVCVGCSEASAQANVYLDGAHLVSWFVNTPPNSSATTGISNFLATVAAGSHTIELKIKSYSGPSFTIVDAYNGSHLSVLAIAN
jgi:hypothetical protein